MPFRGIALPILVLILAPALPAQLTVRLPASARDAFDMYTKNAEAQMDWSPHLPVKNGSVEVIAWKGNSPIQVDGGLIHDWVAGILVRGANAGKALSLFQDYDDYKRTFAPNVADSRLMSHDGNHWHAWLRLRRQSGITVVFNTEYDIEYRPLGEQRFAIISHSTKINELGMDGKELPPDGSHGLLWRLNSYWLIEPRPEGLYLECRVISLSRDVPTGIGWIVKPFVSKVPRESLRTTVEDVRKALR